MNQGFQKGKVKYRLKGFQQCVQRIGAARSEGITALEYSMPGKRMTRENRRAFGQ